MPNRVCPPESKTKVLIVDDHPAVREGLALRISSQPDMTVCGEAADIAQALRQAASTRPDVAVVDIGLKTGSGLELVKRLLARGHKVRILVWSMYDEKLYAERALHAGALGYITKEEATDQIIKAIQQVRAGKVYLSKAMTDRLLQNAVQHTGAAPLVTPRVTQLSDRELEVYRCIGSGLDTRSIAETMHLSPKTVETYQSRIKKKLQLESGRALIQHAIQWRNEEGKTG